MSKTQKPEIYVCIYIYKLMPTALFFVPYLGDPQFPSKEPGA